MYEWLEELSKKLEGVSDEYFTIQYRDYSTRTLVKYGTLQRIVYSVLLRSLK